MRAYEIHTYREGVWKVDSVFDDRELALFEAKRVDDSSRYSGVKVVEEVYDEAHDRTTTRTLFRGGAAKSAKPQMVEAKPKSRRAGPRGGAGKEHARRGRRRKKTHSSILVPFLILIILLLVGLVGLLGLNYLSALK